MMSSNEEDGLGRGLAEEEDSSPLHRCRDQIRVCLRLSAVFGSWQPPTRGGCGLLARLLRGRRFDGRSIFR